MQIPNFIEVYTKVFDTEFCEKAIRCFEDALANGFVVSRQEHDRVAKISKEDLSYFPANFDLSHLNKDVNTHFNNTFWSSVYSKYSEKYGILNNCNQQNIYAIKIQKTEPGQGYHTWHCEAMSRYDCHRVLAWTVYLNDNFEAGETEFLYQQYRYKPSQGDCLVFPASFTHTHRGNPPIGGTKYIITGWLEY